MSHLGDGISALIDGELSGADRDRANAHLASCDRCRGEAAALRLLKRELRTLVERADDDDILTSRLLAMAFLPGDPSDGIGPERGPGRDPARGSPSRPAFRTYQEAFDRGASRRSRHRYLVWGAVSLAVVGSLGAVAFTIGGTSSNGTGPGVVPQVELFNVEHAIDSGDVPFPDPSASHATERATKQAIPHRP